MTIMPSKLHIDCICTIEEMADMLEFLSDEIVGTTIFLSSVDSCPLYVLGVPHLPHIPLCRLCTYPALSTF